MYCWRRSESKAIATFSGFVCLAAHQRMKPFDSVEGQPLLHIRCHCIKVSKKLAHIPWNGVSWTLN